MPISLPRQPGVMNVIMNRKDCTVNVVLREFYAKEVLSKMMLSSRSALPMKVKGRCLRRRYLGFYLIATLKYLEKERWVM